MITINTRDRIEQENNTFALNASRSQRIKGAEKADYIRALWCTDTALDPADLERAIEADKKERLIIIETCRFRGHTYAKMTHRLLFGQSRDLYQWYKITTH
jgi:hypothetical protein